MQVKFGQDPGVKMSVLAKSAMGSLMTTNGPRLAF